jgi:hypothetical protein
VGFFSDVAAMYRPQRWPTMVTPKLPPSPRPPVYFVKDLSPEQLARLRHECQQTPRQRALDRLAAYVLESCRPDD